MGLRGLKIFKKIKDGLQDLWVYYTIDRIEKSAEINL
jgi:hypothetical protein